MKKYIKSIIEKKRLEKLKKFKEYNDLKDEFEEINKSLKDILSAFENILKSDFFFTRKDELKTYLIENDPSKKIILRKKMLNIKQTCLDLQTKTKILDSYFNYFLENENKKYKLFTKTNDFKNAYKNYLIVLNSIKEADKFTRVSSIVFDN
ncbi:MAG: hypothetical protein PHR26_02895 [Candidatus ainarchaeum sp.]|nr:hypothetical protein [Candidatus ainarchaeum sp.]MDD3975948.1 hypothetical protein [Candidatus ainarchaeum sp.]